ncbi:MAG: putative solute:sodium symporter small subunit [Verrucomicrobiales bacterium]|jgi:putative solute:sodium symporter small subunit
MSENDSKPDASKMKLYWKKNIRCVLCLLVVWFVVSHGCGILFVDELDQFRIPGTGFKVGFWFAQQGSIVIFLALIGIYVRYMNKLDKEFDVEEHDA